MSSFFSNPDHILFAGMFCLIAAAVVSYAYKLRAQKQAEARRAAERKAERENWLAQRASATSASRRPFNSPSSGTAARQG